MYPRYTRLKVVHAIARKVAIFDNPDIGTADGGLSTLVVIRCFFTYKPTGPTIMIMIVLIIEFIVGKDAVIAPPKELHVRLWEQRLSYWSLN